MIQAHTAMRVSEQHPDAPEEPLLEIGEIQGNSILGFMKPRMGVMALSFGEIEKARKWVAAIAAKATTIEDMLPSRVAVRSERLARRVTAGFTEVVGTLDDRWMNVAFSHAALAKLIGAPGNPGAVGMFGDEAFRAGLAARSALLGDPVDPSAEGNPRNWVFGGPDREPDALLVFGADQEASMTEMMAEHRQAAVDAGMGVLYEEQGGKLDPEGHEHFGFQDGVSQPGVRGRINAEMFLVERTIAPDVLPEAWLYGRPGQHLIWPGSFLFGYETPGADPMLPAPPTLPGPAWSRNGSYVVYRRLRQDVAGFRAFAAEEAEALSRQGMTGVTASTLEASLVGRWPSGAPIARVPAGDDPALGRDPLANNHFGFAADTPTLRLAGGGTTNTYPEAHADPVGLTCPLAAHIRKVNTRDVGSDQGGRRSSFQRRVLRRGLPYGSVLPETGPDPDNGNRGLMFLSYQASIVDQFEFLNTAWMSDPVAPRSPSGHDMVIGQNGQPGEDRERRCVLFGHNSADELMLGNVSAVKDVVISTGGGYFFSPSISAMRKVLSAAPEG
jgi:Dyp-type peroxidase family